MRFKSILVENFKAITALQLNDLKDFILIAGPNGCGKSCILDAIRLLKSAYGGYLPDEWQQWFGEFLIDVNDRRAVRKLLRDPDRPVILEAQVELSDDEISYLHTNMEEVLEPRVWRQLTGHSNMQRRLGLASLQRELGSRFDQELQRQSADMRTALEAPYDHLRVELQPNGAMNVASNPVMELVFETYDPQHIGIVDYHSASRNYQRESLGGVDLNIRNLESQQASQALYNAHSKYQNVKSELAITFMRDLLAQAAGVVLPGSDLNTTLKDLFQAFFPDKEYLGVLPDADGALKFPVRTSAGEHDINELSSGEKEIVYGYLRLRNSAPRNSTILLDEPELHLNPGLLRAMPAFYHEHLGRARSNQLWLVTHSDALLRHAVGNANFSVFHMSPPIDDVPNQVAEVLADDELERATMALVGDLATYMPRSKVVILEGGGDVDFDVMMIQRLFPEAAKRLNIVSGGSKRHVKDLQDVLSQTAVKVGLPNRFFVIVDKDSETEATGVANTRRYTWDRYHIENYLLSEKYLMLCANAAAGKELFPTEAAVRAALKECAAAVAPRVVIERLTWQLDLQLTTQVRLGGDPSSRSASASLRPSLKSSLQKLEAAHQELLEGGGLESKEEQIEKEVAEALEGESWVESIPGRAVLKEFVNRHVEGVAYGAFRQLIIDRMVGDSYQPSGVAKVLDQILAVDIDTSAESD